MTTIFFCRKYMHSLNQSVFCWPKITQNLLDDNLILLYRNINLVLAKACYITPKNAPTFQMTILSLCREIYAYCWPRRVYCTKITRIPFGWQSYSFIKKYVHSLSQSVFYCSRIERLAFGWQSCCFVRKYILSLSQGVLYCTKTAHLPFRWQSYLLYRNICIVLAKACYTVQKTRLPFWWQSYSFVEKYVHSLGQGVF